jgi:hypothetical protein
VRVLSVDKVRRRISLSAKTPTTATPTGSAPQQRPQERGPAPRPSSGGYQGNRPRDERRPFSSGFTANPFGNL